MKRCPRCKETKSFEEFALSKDGKPSAYCYPCGKMQKQETRARHSSTYEDRAKDNVKTRKWYAANKKRVKLTYIQSNYGLSPEEYEALPKECAICGTTENIVMDHDHATNKFRGVLCRNHNSGLGMFNDDPEMLLRAVDYLFGFLKPHIVEMVKKMVGK